LAIRRRQRDPVLVDADAAHTELRPCTESASLDLRVLRVVVAVVGGDARNADQALGGVHLRLAELNIFGVDNVNRHGQIKTRARLAGGGHHDWRGFVGVGDSGKGGSDGSSQQAVVQNFVFHEKSFDKRYFRPGGGYQILSRCSRFQMLKKIMNCEHAYT